MSLQDEKYKLLVLLAIVAVLPALFSGMSIAQADSQIEIKINDSQNGQDSENVSIVVEQDTNETPADGELPTVPDDFPGSKDAFRAIDNNDDGSLGSIELATAISNNGEFEDYPELEIGSIEFAQIISWNGSN